MNRSTTTVAGVALALALAYPAASWYLGKRVEEISKAQLQTQLSALPYIKIVRDEYDRRLFDATQTVTLELPAAMFMMPRMSDNPVGKRVFADGQEDARQEAPEQQRESVDAVKPIQVTIITDIKHGPLPGFKALGAASTESRLSFDAEMQKTVDAAFGGKPPLTASALIGFTGSGSGVVRVAAFSHRAPKPEGGEYVFSGDAMEASVDFSRGMKRYTISGKMPRMEVVDDAKMLISGIAFSGDQARVFDDDPMLLSGKQRVTVERIEISSPEADAQPVLMKNFVLEGDIPSPPQPVEFVDMIGKIGIEEFKLGEQNYGPAHYDFSFRHLNARKLSTVYRNAMALYPHLPMEGENLPSPEDFQPFMASLQDLMFDNAEFSLDRLSFNSPHGQTQISAKIKMNDANAQDLRNPLALIGKLDLSADLNMPEALLTDFLTAASADEEAGHKALQRQAMLQGQLDRFVAQGYIARADGILKSKIEFRHGKLVVNDKPFNLFGGLPK